MSVWKSLTLGLLSFLLFLSLSIFGLAFLINSTLLNPKFLDREISRLDMPLLVEELLDEEIAEPEMSSELKAAIVDNTERVEPLVKEQASAFINSVYDYLRGKRQNPELADTLRNTFLSEAFIDSLVAELDIQPLATEIIQEQLADEVPADMGYLVDYADDYLDEVVAGNEQLFENQISHAAEPIIDYLLGESRSLEVTLTMEPVIEDLAETMREPFLASPPSEIATIPESQLALYYDMEFERLAEQSSSFVIDESTFPPDLPAEMSNTITEAEDILQQSTGYVSIFRIVYILLIVFMLLMVAGIILIRRDVRHITRDLGISFLIYGAIEFAIILIGKYFIGKFLPFSDMTPYMEMWLRQFLSDFLAPLLWLSLGLIIVGIILIVFSYLYKRGQNSATVPPTEPLPENP